MRAVAVTAAAALIALLATLAAAGKQAPLAVRLGSRPPGLVVGQAWTATLLVRRGPRRVAARPTLVARSGELSRSFKTRPVGRGRYRSVVRLRLAGAWTLSARIGRRTFALGRITVREAAVTLRGPTGIARGPNGEIVVADRTSGRILRLDIAARRLSVIARDLVQPTGLDVDAGGNIWVADDSGNRVVRIAPDGAQRVFGDIPTPLDVAVCPGGSVLVTGRDSRVRRIDNVGTVTNFAGTGEEGYGGDNGPAAQAILRAPHGIVCDAAGNVLLADSYRIRRIDRASGIITTIAGNGQTGFAGDGGPAEAGLVTPLRLEPAPDGSIYVADNDNNRIRRISPDGMLSTVAGSGRAEDLKPFDLVLAGNGSLIVVELNPTPRIRRVDPATGAIETLVGPR
jgi:DNA-binding beta-propeller fold protein YncE